MGVKRIKGYKPTVVDDIKFHSKLEAYFYECMRDKKFHMELQYKIILQPKFEFNGIKYREVSKIVDFAIHDVKHFIEIKGHETDKYKLQEKLVCYAISGQYPDWSYIKLKSKKEINDYVYSLQECKA